MKPQQVEASSDEETSSEEAESDTTDDTSTAEEQVITGTITESAEGYRYHRRLRTEPL